MRARSRQALTWPPEKSLKMAANQSSLGFRFARGADFAQNKKQCQIDLLRSLQSSARDFSCGAHKLADMNPGFYSRAELI